MSQEPFTKEEIAKKAYEIWLHRQANGIDGSSEDDWEEAVNYYKKRKDLIWKWRLMKNLKLVSIPFKSTLHFFWKTLPTSDWMKLLAVPLILSFAGSVITSQIQEENRQNETVNKYFEQMEKLFLNDKLDLSEADNPLRILIKSRSNAVLRSVDLKRKEVIIGFLAEAGLLTSKTIKEKEKAKEIEGVSLSFLDLTENPFDITKPQNGFKRSLGINLSGLNLKKAHFEETILSNANLKYANLIGADLKGANLEGANLIGADLKDAKPRRANLKNANLQGADLENADLEDADLENAVFYRADLKNADLENANLKGANLSNLIDPKNPNLTNKQIKSACNWESAYYYGKFWDSETRTWKISDEDKKRNKYIIRKLRKDKASDPNEKPDCDKWED